MVKIHVQEGMLRVILRDILSVVQYLRNCCDDSSLTVGVGAWEHPFRGHIVHGTFLIGTYHTGAQRPRTTVRGHII
jgi:hypothetical protein